MSIVLIGYTGSGKTTLYNKITKSNEEVKAGGSSVTKNVFMKNSCEGSGFKVLDTPGLLSLDSGKVDHVAGVLAALAEGPLNRILIVTNFKRTNKMLNEVEEIIAPFLNYRVMITVVVTCWDLCLPENSEQNQKYIREKLGKLQINSVLFVGLEDSAESICNQIDQIIAISKQNKVELSEDDIYGNFDLTEQDDDEGVRDGLYEWIQQHQQSQLRCNHYFKIVKEQINYLSKAEEEKFFEEFVKFAQKPMQARDCIQMDKLKRQKNQNQQFLHKEELMKKIQEQTYILRKQRAK